MKGLSQVLGLNLILLYRTFTVVSLSPFVNTGPKTVGGNSHFACVIHQLHLHLVIHQLHLHMVICAAVGFKV